MSKNRSSPLQRVWQGVLLVLGIVIVAQLVLSLLAQIWGWLLLIASVVLIVVVVVRILRFGRDRW